MALTDLQEALANYITKYNTNYQSPELFDGLVKSYISRNITLDDWNAVAEHLRNCADTSESLYTVIVKFNSWLQNAANHDVSSEKVIFDDGQTLDQVIDSTLNTLDNKVDKTNIGAQVYGTHGDGNQRTISYDVLPGADTIALRSASGDCDFNNVGIGIGKGIAFHYTNANGGISDEWLDINGVNKLKNLNVDSLATKDYVDEKLSTTVDTNIEIQLITYVELKTLRDSGTLVPGKQYRITDYQCTTTESNTSSAGHQFDIIVIADSASVLNENARAVLHEGDTYFANCNLKAWQLKYCIDNDTTRFEWADETNGKGVIYYMKDEFNNECPYDFKNILYTGSSFDKSVSFTNAYTFTYTEDSTLKDASILGETKSCYNNVIKSSSYIYYLNNTQLNRNIFYSTSINFGCNNNTFGSNCYNNTFGNYCSKNTFGRNCSKSTFDNSCSENTFGNGCYENKFGQYCICNTFGHGCAINTFGTNCEYNTFGNRNYLNRFENYCSHNIFGGLCFSNIFGSTCNDNFFGNHCSSNVAGSYFFSNSLGNECNGNSFGNGCVRNSFGNLCGGNIFGNECHNNTFNNGCKNNKFGTANATINHCQYNIFDNGCCYISLYSTDTDASASNFLQNVHIHLGVYGSSSSNRLPIEVPDRALKYEYNVTKAGTITEELL